MYTVKNFRIVLALFVCAVSLGWTPAFSKANTTFPEMMKSAISKYEKSKGKGVVPTIEIDNLKTNRTVMTVSPPVVKGQAAPKGYRITFYDCRADQSACQSIRFETSRPATSVGNTCGDHWTNTFRFGRVRADNSGMLSLDMTQLIYKDIKPEDLQFTLGIWSAILNDFDKLLEPGSQCNPVVKPAVPEAPATTFEN